MATTSSGSCPASGCYGYWRCLKFGSTYQRIIYLLADKISTKSCFKNQLTLIALLYSFYRFSFYFHGFYYYYYYLYSCYFVTTEALGLLLLFWDYSIKSVPICRNDIIFLGWQKAHMKFIRQQIDRRRNKMYIFSRLCDWWNVYRRQKAKEMR